MSREAYIRRQREEHGRKAVAVLPIHYPKELLTALDLLAVEVWGPPGAPRGDAAGRIQAYVCAVVRNALAFLASGGADAVDAALFPHTCDSIQQLATLAADFGGWGKPTLTFLHPKDHGRPSARRFLAEELRALASRLEEVAGRRLDPERLAAAIRLHREIDAHRAALLDGRATLPLDDRELYALLRRGEWLWPAEHLAELAAARTRLGTGSPPAGVPVLVTGYVPEPMSLFDSLESAGAFVVVDDYAAVGRRLQPRPPARVPVLVTGYVPEPAATLEILNGAGAFVAADDYAAVGRRVVRDGNGPLPLDDPWQALVDRTLAAPPCPTRSTDQEARMRHLAALAERSGARGVVVHVVKFCEPELFDVPAIRRTFADRGTPLLYLEGELERQLSGQTVTRLEAFVEMIAGAGGAA
jgi:benzoyl-CoA reductase/2-hydroxyglutaryl-CoA dehydratase subunit BcrC/BadD/HgdB